MFCRGRGSHTNGNFAGESNRTTPVGRVFAILFDHSTLMSITDPPFAFEFHGDALKLHQNGGEFGGKTWITIAKSYAFDCANVAGHVEAEITPDEMPAIQPQSKSRRRRFGQAAAS